jgi:hypothetical protein
MIMVLDCFALCARCIFMSQVHCVPKRCLCCSQGSRHITEEGSNEPSRLCSPAGKFRPDVADLVWRASVRCSEFEYAGCQVHDEAVL